jgi:hypothetical protein
MNTNRIETTIDGLRSPLAGIIAGLVCLMPFSAGAADDAIYDAPPPPDAAFVRVLNARPAEPEAITIGSAAYSVPARGISPYNYVTRGDYSVGDGLDLTLEAQKFYTVVVQADGTTTVLVDDPLMSPSKAGLYFYNITAAPATLMATVNGKQAAVFEDVPPGEVKFREVKAFEVSFQINSGGQQVADLSAVTLQNQQGFSVIALAADGAITGINTVNTVDTK